MISLPPFHSVFIFLRFPKLCLIVLEDFLFNGQKMYTRGFVNGKWKSARPRLNESDESPTRSPEYPGFLHPRTVL